MQPHRRQPTRLLRSWDSPGKNTGVGCHFLLQRTKMKSESEVAQLCPTPSDPMDCSLQGSSIHGIFRQEYWSGVSLPSLTVWATRRQIFKYPDGIIFSHLILEKIIGKGICKVEPKGMQFWKQSDLWTEERGSLCIFSKWILDSYPSPAPNPRLRNKTLKNSSYLVKIVGAKTLKTSFAYRNIIKEQVAKYLYYLPF